MPATRILALLLAGALVAGCDRFLPTPQTDLPAPRGSSLYVLVQNHSVEPITVTTTSDDVDETRSAESAFDGCSAGIAGVATDLTERERVTVEVDGVEVLSARVPRLADGVHLVVRLVIDATGDPSADGPAVVSGAPAAPAQPVACR